MERSRCEAFIGTETWRGGVKMKWRWRWRQMAVIAPTWKVAVLTERAVVESSASASAAARAWGRKRMGDWGKKNACMHGRVELPR